MNSKASLTEHQLNFYDGTSKSVWVSQQAFPYPAGQLIISRTDLQGVITHCNDAFVLLSGYEKEELIGAPHYLIRHPDMPQSAFADLWATVKKGKKWSGYVKNLRKNGDYYWVYATVVPCYRQGKIVGYASVRRQASAEKIAHYEALYQQMRKEEAQA
ncbi:MAG: PAS domain-containing protein [Cardiobacteriaceae bacterium]|nr:PAS domain-containing protein [Cardiobacteriaceae bacterium]